MTPPTERPFDPGLQPERTALAWQRTALALAIGLLVGARLVADLGADWAPVLAAAGIIAIAALLAVGHRRYRRVHLALTSTPERALPGAGALVAWVVAATALGCLGALAIALHLFMR